MVRCPGQDQRFWKPKDIFEVSCPDCGRAVEFFRDEPILKCPGCGRTVVNSRLDMGCAEWCKHADQCIGASTIRNIKTVRDKLIARMKDVFGQDEKRIDHALRVLSYAEQIGTAEGADPLVIRAAAILHDIGIHEAERKYNSTAGHYQEIEGPPIAEPILKENDVDPARIEHICRIIANHHSAKDIDTLEFRVLWDADWLVNLQDDFADVGEQKRREMIDKVFRTDKGRQLARELFPPDGQATPHVPRIERVQATQMGGSVKAEGLGDGVSPLRVAGILPAIRGQDALDTKEQGQDGLATEDHRQAALDDATQNSTTKGTANQQGSAGSQP